MGSTGCHFTELLRGLPRCSVDNGNCRVDPPAFAIAISSLAEEIAWLKAASGTGEGTVTAHAFSL